MNRSFGAIRRRLLGAALAFSLGGCAGLSPRVDGLLDRLPAEAPSASEKAFSILWWEKADSGEGLPFKPLEPAIPEVDAANGTVFAATSDGKVRAFGRQRQLLWEFDARGPFNAGPTLVEDRLFLATSEGKLLALDVGSGKPVWEYSTGEELMTRPVVAEGLVLAMSAADTLVAVDQDSGAWKWQYRREQPDQFTVRGAARPLVLDGKVYAGFADGFAVSLDLQDGTVEWAKELATGRQFLDVDADPVADDWGHVFFASFASGIVCLDGTTGSTLWTQKRQGVTALTIDAAANRLYAGGTEFVGAFAADSGQAQWSLDLGRDRFVSGLTTHFGHLIAATGPGPLLFLDPKSGRLRKAFDPGHGVTAAPASLPYGEAVILSNRGFLYALALVGSGKP